jgi:hypothetical protein
MLVVVVEVLMELLHHLVEREEVVEGLINKELLFQQ